MAKKSMTIEDVRKAKDGLDKKIFDLISGFEKDTKVRVSYIDLNRFRNSTEPIREQEEDDNLLDVSVNLSVDFL